MCWHLLLSRDILMLSRGGGGRVGGYELLDICVGSFLGSSVLIPCRVENSYCLLFAIDHPVVLETCYVCSLFVLRFLFLLS